MNYPKVELHCHMDGAIPARLFAKYCREDGLIPEGMSDEQWVKSHVMSDTMTLGECMGLFGILTGILNTKERLEETAFELLKDMYESGIKLVELRFSPQSHLSDTLSMEDSIEAVLRGRQRVLKLYPDMVCGFLICMMNLSLNLGTVKNNFRTVELAAKYKGQGVVGIDLAGNETGTPIENYEPQFELARKLGVKYTIHAGESGPASNVKFAIDQQAPRIGHGIHSIYDDKVVDELVDKGFNEEVVNSYINLFTILEGKSDVTQAINCLREELSDTLDEDVAESMKEIALAVDNSKVAKFDLVFDPTLVRGMSYYTGTIFEIAIPEFGGSCGGGGRYDEMIGRFTGGSVPACGFSIGFERIILLLLEQDFKIPTQSKKIAYLIDKKLPYEKYVEVIREANDLRAKGENILVVKMNKNKKFQKEQLTQEGYEEFKEFFAD